MPQRKLLSFLQSSAIRIAVIFLNPKNSSFRVSLRRRAGFPEKKKTLITPIKQATYVKQHNQPKSKKTFFSKFCV